MATVIFWTNYRHWLPARHHEHMPASSSSINFSLARSTFRKISSPELRPIVTGKFVGSHIGIPWRITFCALLMLPLGFSVAYKRFLESTASAVFSTISPGRDGIEYPLDWTESSGTDFLSTSISAVTDFRNTVLGRAPFPQPEELPVAYGYNTLLLGDGSAALLDMPSVLYLMYLRVQTFAEEAIDITASVDAYQAKYDAQSANLQINDELWSNITSKAIFNTIYTHIRRINQEVWAMGFFFEPNAKEESDRFRPRAQMFGINRARCHAHWTVTTSSISLVDGTCGADFADSSVLRKPDITPWYVEALPMILRMHTNTTTPEKESVWLRATYAVNIATRQGSLYFILLVQPALTVLGFVIAIWLHKTPIGRNFGIVALLAGLHESNLATFKGAGLSGKVEKPVELEITIRQTSLDNNASGRHGQGGKIQYLVKPEPERDPEGVKKQRDGSRLSKGCEYQ